MSKVFFLKGYFYGLSVPPTVQGFELWTTDGTPSGTHAISSLNGGATQSLLSDWGFLGNNLILAANGPSGRDFYSVDATTNVMTKYASDISPYGNLLGGAIATLDGVVYYGVDMSGRGIELWRSDGTAGGTRAVTNATAEASTLEELSFSSIFAASGKVYFTGNNTGALFAYDPATDAVSVLHDFDPGAATSGRASNFVSLGSKFLFTGTETATGTEVWVSDGTPGGTHVLVDLVAGPDESFVDKIGVLNGKGIFSAQPDGATFGDYTLYVTDGTAGGTKAITTPGTVRALAFFRGEGSKLYFSGYSGTSGTELWVTDGTSAGTHIVKNLNPSNAMSGIRTGVEHNGIFYFWGDDGSTGTELYKTDGTEAGTVLVKDFRPGLPSGYVSGSMEFVGNDLYFVARDDVAVSYLYRSDGTEAGTVKLSTTLAYSVIDSPGAASVTITGTSKGDKIDATHSPAGQPKPTNGDEIINALGGKDTVKALGGSDTVDGGKGADSIDGGAGDDLLKGGADGDTVLGGKGNDTIYGGKGKDSLDGGKGKDAFVFDTKLEAANVDKVVKFVAKDDTIWLDKDIFTKLGAIGTTIGTDAFWKNTSGKAHDKSDRIVYDSNDGTLTYDSNGNKSGGATVIAVLDKGLALTQADFLIV